MKIFYLPDLGAADEIAAEHALPKEDSVIKRVIVVGNINLAEPAIHLRQIHRGAPHPQRFAVAGHPIRRVDGAHQKVGNRRASPSHGTAAGSHHQECGDREQPAIFARFTFRV